MCGCHLYYARGACLFPYVTLYMLPLHTSSLSVLVVTVSVSIPLSRHQQTACWYPAEKLNIKSFILFTNYVKTSDNIVSEASLEINFLCTLHLMWQFVFLFSFCQRFSFFLMLTRFVVLFLLNTLSLIPLHFYVTFLPGFENRFDWVDYLKETQSIAAPVELFKQVCHIKM